METVAGNRVVTALGMRILRGKLLQPGKALCCGETMRWVRSKVVSSRLMDLLLPAVIFG